MGDKAGIVGTESRATRPSRAAPIPKGRKKVPIEPVGRRGPAAAPRGRRKKQTAAQRRASLANLAKAKQARS